MRFNTDSTPNEEKKSVPMNLDALNKSLDDFTEKKEEFNKMKADLIQNFRLSLEAMAKQIFVTIPELKAISWMQYTPYFNDGDECTFRIREIIYYGFIPEDGFFRYAEQIDEEEYPEGSWAVSDYDLKKSGLSPEAVSFLKNFDTTINQNREFIKEIFNDHSKISWTADGINIEDYSDHD